ncbi:uncharacterized protein QC761_0016000 [Podospora bellae-mahoneyi]|uniref:Uncharacterized protein n=1 Tax=Podospora bellae-mahoneyi TaxID=2093777 RepID=A0ABR0FZL4_9PEZI|nr:hypothetical protein QC761_0016000 [Podospora bellae-mahoneyi]
MRRLQALYDAGSWMGSIQGGKKWQNCFSEARTSCSVFGVLAKKFGGQMGPGRPRQLPSLLQKRHSQPQGGFGS